MGYEAKIIADSISVNGNRLTTMEVTFPRIVLAEFNTHRMFSRNSASSRAIPVEKMIERVKTDPFIPIWWGKNQSGMQAKAELEGADLEDAKQLWLEARNMVMFSAEAMLMRGVHKQITNRLLEPWLWHTVIVSATDWSNFFALRCHPDAQPEIQKIAFMMRDLYETSKPGVLTYGAWHLPYITNEQKIQHPIEELQIMSVARCARVSYLRHSSDSDYQKDVELFNRLSSAGHMSPFEHVARPRSTDEYFGNFKGWQQLRKLIPNENR